MNRTLVLLCLVLAFLAAAGSASAEFYASLRLVGNGNFFLRGSMLGGSPLEIVNDSGLYTAKEVALGFGDTFQGEVAFGFDSLTATDQDMDVLIEDEMYEIDEYEESATSWWVGGAGFYQVYQTQNARVDLGLRFQYLSASITTTLTEEGDDLEMKFSATGWSAGPVIRHTWMLADGKIGIGPEVSLRYTTATSEIENTYPDEPRATFSEDGPEYTGWDLDYSLRMDFFF